MEKRITQNLFIPSTEERPLPETALRLTAGPIDAFRLGPTPPAPAATKAVVFFHGHRGNITWYADHARSLAAAHPDHDVWVFEYPGYGKLTSQGAPKVAQLMTSAYQFLTAVQAKYKTWTWVAESIGAPIALGVLARLDAKRALAVLPGEVHLINTFASVSSMADLTHPDRGAGRLVQMLGYDLNTVREAKTVRLKFTSIQFRVYRARDVTSIPDTQMVRVADSVDQPLRVLEGDETAYQFPPEQKK